MKHASLFSGIGGPEIAAAMMGWENAFHCEINPFGRAILNYWFPNSVSYEDITKTDFRKWRGQIDVLTGGFPCQPFSYAGKRKGRNDERYLWPEMLRAIDEIRPAWVVGENVGGIATMVENGVFTELECDTDLFGAGNDIYRYELRESYTLERICKDLESIQYETQPFLIPDCAVNAPHRRDRIFIVAHNATDAPCEQGNGNGFNEFEHCKQGQVEFGGRSREDYTEFLPENRWREFPTVPPVHGRNDGLPFPVDNLTISFGKWRTESLKAYGNAIVPQVMFRIFEAIEFASKEK